MGAYEVANGLESAAVARLKAIYESALRTALRRQHAFLAQIKAIDEGRIKCPQYYIDRGKEKEWREGFTRELLRKNKVIEGIMEDLNAVGGDAADIIREFTCDVYDVTRKETIEILAHEAAKMDINPSFATYNKRQIGVLIQEAQSPFSKLAYANLGKNTAVRRRLQNEMAQAAILGESQQKLVKRIRSVTGQLTWQAKRVAQTERTRVQSQARFEAGAEAQALGVKVYHEWSTRMINSRDTHIALNGKKAMQGEKFPGSMLRFPGDPNAPASEVINCHCVLIPGVLLPGEELKSEKDIGQGTANKHKANDNAKENPPVTIAGLDCKISKREFGFNDGAGGAKKTVNAVVYETPDGTQFIFPEKYNKKQQTMTPEQALSLWAKVPENVRKNAQKTIQFVDYYNPWDAKWRKRYKNFSHSYATGGKTITFWRYDFPHDEAYVVRTYCHEIGHFIDRNLAKTADRFSSETKWINAIADDMIITKKLSCTRYGENSKSEDFAESVAEYAKNKEKFEKNFPNRAAILAEILN